MKPSIEKQNKRLGKLETIVLLLFGLTLVVWIANKFININILLTICIVALLAASIALLISVLKALLQRKSAKAKPIKKTIKPKKRKIAKRKK